jgi:hypothetical protein
VSQRLIWVLVAPLCACAELYDPQPYQDPDGLPQCDAELLCELEPRPSSGDPRADCVDRINQFRTECACLPPLERWTEGESCADEQAEYDSTRGAHAGFSARICASSGAAQNECPGWDSAASVVAGCLQRMWDEGPPPAGRCTGQCFEQHGHFVNMASQRYRRVACGFFTTAEGEVWSVQNFAP